MRIGIVTSWFERGAAYVSRQYADSLRPQHEVFIYSRGGERAPRGDPEWDQPYVTWGKPALLDESSAVDLQDFVQWVRRERIECVFFNEQRSWPAVIWCAQNRILNGAYVVHYREDTIPFFDCHDFLICNARHHAHVFRDHPQSLFLPWGTDLQRFYPSGHALVNPDRVTFFHSGGMNPHRKGTEIVLEAFAAVCGPVHLVLHVQANLEASAQLQQLLDAGRVTLIDRTVPDMAELYRMGDVCVYPTRHEGLGLTIAESLASGLPILVTDQVPVSEHADGRTVRTVEVEYRYGRPDGDFWPQTRVSTQALTAAMQEIADQRNDLPAIKLEARKRAESNTDWAKNAATLAEHFASFKLNETTRKMEAVAGAEEFEQRKWSLGFRNWLGTRYPGLVRTVRRLRNV